MLQTLGISAVLDAVVGLKSDAFAGELPLGVFVPVQTQLGRVRKVGTELEKERAEIALNDVDVAVVDHRRGLDEPRHDRPVRGLCRLVVRNTEAFSCALPTKMIPSSAAKLRSRSAITSSLHWAVTYRIGSVSSTRAHRWTGSAMG
ncbi:MAG: hypothetical protein JO189_15175 [Deltaproteobacteria bacterium]|nr:hypothetical protein [Deltaproteobacteria bacterium]